MFESSALKHPPGVCGPWTLRFCKEEGFQKGLRFGGVAGAGPLQEEACLRALPSSTRQGLRSLDLAIL